MEKQGMNTGYNSNSKAALTDPEVFSLDLLPMPKVLEEAYASLGQ